MTRQQKYPDTSTFHFHNQNPHGRLTCDCVERAISKATGVPYNQVIRDLIEIQVETGYDASSNEAIDRYMKTLGWIKHKQPRKPDGTKFTGVEFCRELSRWDSLIYDGCDFHNIVANIGGGHSTAIIECRVNDTWNCTDGCIGIYWTKGV